MPCDEASKYIDQLANRLGAPQHNVDEIEKFFVDGMVVEETVSSEDFPDAYPAAEMDTSKGAEKRPLSSSGDADSERSCAADDFDPFVKFHHATNFPSSFNNVEGDDLDDEIIPQVVRAGFLHDALPEIEQSPETPCLLKRMTKKTKSA